MGGMPRIKLDPEATITIKWELFRTIMRELGRRVSTNTEGEVIIHGPGDLSFRPLPKPSAPPTRQRWRGGKATSAPRTSNTGRTDDQEAQEEMEASPAMLPL
jgi:hypothetical protein